MMGDDPAIDQSTESIPSPPPTSSEGDADAGVPCRHLRNKGMYVYNGIYGVPHDDYDNTIFWCGKTLKGFGPDEEMVGRDDCTNPERACHEPL